MTAVSRVESADLDPDPIVLAPLEVRALGAPHPVLGADDRIHLAYELALVNASPLLVTIDRVSVLAPGKDRAVVQVLEGSALASVIRRRGGEGAGPLLRPSHSALIFMDVSFPSSVEIPRHIRHEFVLSLQTRDHDPGDHTDVAPPRPGAAPDPSPPATLTFVTDPLNVNREAAVVVSPPLHGPRWYVANGCCTHANAHRAAALPLNGTLFLPERFAIDFVQLGPDYRLFSGDGKRNSDYAYFGARVRAAAGGVIVRAIDGIADNPPGSFPPNPTLATAGGNHVVIDMGNGTFAFYAHLQNGSVTKRKLRAGQRIRAGEVLGLLGNSGNSDAPHLHFHLMDGPDPLRANGLPFVFGYFEGQGAGTADDEAALFAGRAAAIDAAAFRSAHHKRLPLDFELVRLSSE